MEISQNLSSKASNLSFVGKTVSSSSSSPSPFHLKLLLVGVLRQAWVAWKEPCREFRGENLRQADWSAWESAVRASSSSAAIRDLDIEVACCGEARHRSGNCEILWLTWSSGPRLTEAKAGLAQVKSRLCFFLGVAVLSSHAISFDLGHSTNSHEHDTTFVFREVCPHFCRISLTKPLLAQRTVGATSGQSPQPAHHPAASAAVTSFFSTPLPKRFGKAFPSKAARICLQIGAPVVQLVHVPPKCRPFAQPSSIHGRVCSASSTGLAWSWLISDAPPNAENEKAGQLQFQASRRTS